MGQRAATAKFDLKPTFTHGDGGRSTDDEQSKEKPDDTTEATTLADDLAAIYLDYIDCLNRQDWTELKHFVDDEVRYNDQLIGLSGYHEMLERDFREIPDLHFDVRILICEPPHVASR